MQSGNYKHVGVVQIYPWRPHASQRDFLLKLVREEGYQLSELVCNGSTVKCYDKQYQTLGWGGLDHCVKCRLGSSKIRNDVPRFALDWTLCDIAVDGEDQAMLSNRAALIRAEVASDLENGEDNIGVRQAYRVGYHSAVKWIDAFGVDLILLFNGRIDILRGVMDAARARGVDFASYERSWFGDGIMLIPGDNCLGLSLMHELVATVGKMELSADQAMRAATVIRRRVERLGSNEWRDFQTQSLNWHRDVRDALGSAYEILVLPSSMYEVWGHSDWNTGWRDNFEAMDWLQSKLDVPWSRWVLRGHPIWGQRVGKSLGEHAARHYKDFCASRGIRYIEADSPLHTSALIDAAELVVVNGGSSVIDAVWRGKPVVSLSESAFRNAGICPTVLSPDDDIDIPNDADRKRQLVRFIHGMDRMMPTFVDHLVSISPAEQLQYEGAAFQDVVDQIRDNTLVPPGKNTAPVGHQIQWPPSMVERTRKLFRVGDR
jgi:hypothetical protein